MDIQELDKALTAEWSALVDGGYCEPVEAVNKISAAISPKLGMTPERLAQHVQHLAYVETKRRMEVMQR